MNSKLVTLLALLPLISLLAYKLLKQPAKPFFLARQTDANPSLQQSSVKKKTVRVAEKKIDESEINANLVKLRDENTEIIYAEVDRAADEIVDVYRKNDPKVVVEFKSVFDNWDLNLSDRDAVADTVSHYRHFVADTWNKYYKSWPLEVGHATNIRGGTEHLNRLAKKIDTELNNLHSELKKVVGEDRATELVVKIHPRFSRTKVIDD
ncbi:MAG: hypothetical protein NTV80_01205 [Verrucomicrobia bacterium]|nr:hypothetical protein [Verrucomicrobiota bacterium]